MVDDIILGGGQIGKAIGKIVGTDIFMDVKKEISTYTEDHCEVLHVCIPFWDREDFINNINLAISKCQPQYIIIHSTVEVGTTRFIQTMLEKSTTVYSPILGRHPDLAHDIRHYVKLFASIKHSAGVTPIMNKRFEVTNEVQSVETLELSKLVETTYLGLLVEFTKLVDELAHNDEAVWYLSSFAHNRHHDRPIMYNNHKDIGGHCIIPNLKLFPSKIEGGYNEKYPVLDQLVSILLHSAKEKISTSAEGAIKKMNV